MNAARRLELQASLRRELGRQTAALELSSTGRVLWLIDQIENYIERWHGLRASAASMVPLPNDDLFRMIEIGAEVVSAELQTAGSPLIEKHWAEFLALLTAIRNGSDAPESPSLAESLAAVRSGLHS